MGFRALLLAAVTVIVQPASAAELRVFAAASLTDALDAALVVCAHDIGVEATGIYAGSGTIARQIEQGAPADIYISANPQWMDWLDKRDRIARATRFDLLGNALVVIAKPDSDGNFPSPEILEKSHPTLEFAVGETNSVPSGIYARQAFETLGWWDAVRNGGLIEASNVREVLTWVIRGEVTLGIVYRTDALNVERVTIAYDFPADTHDPILYPAAVIADRDTPNARRLLTCLKGKKASDIFSEFGFSQPSH